MKMGGDVRTLATAFLQSSAQALSLMSDGEVLGVTDTEKEFSVSG